MFGTIGTPEMMVIFVLALILFGPKKLPELGRTIGKALTEFRKASSELKSTFDREMQNLEAETQLKDVTKDLQLDTYNYDYSSYDHPEHTYDGSYGSEQPYDSAADIPSTESASAHQDAESPTVATPEGVIARGSSTETLLLGPEEHPSEKPAPATAEHNV